MIHLRPAVHRTVLVVDIQHFGDLTRTNEHQIEMRAGLYSSLERSFDIAGIPWDHCLHEDRGDGVYLLAPSLIPKARFVEDLPGALAAELRNYNSIHPPAAQIRLRMALHAGEVRFDDHGRISPASILTFRLVDAPALKSVLADFGADLALIVSLWFYDEVVRHSPRAAAEAFHQVLVSVKETTVQAWLTIPVPVEHQPTDMISRNGSGPVLSGDLFFAAVDVLESIPCMGTELDRVLVIKHLRPAMAGSIRYHPHRRAHIMSILHTCGDYDGGISELMAAIAKIEGAESLSVQRLVDLLGGTAT